MFSKYLVATWSWTAVTERHVDELSCCCLTWAGVIELLQGIWLHYQLHGDRYAAEIGWGQISKVLCSDADVGSSGVHQLYHQGLVTVLADCLQCARQDSQQAALTV